MIEAIVKQIDYVDELPTAGNGPFMLAMNASIGPRDSNAADNFQFIICNGAWLSQTARLQGAFWPRSYLIVETFDESYIRQILQILVSQFSRSATWGQFGERLNRYLLWEFEDYNDDQGTPSIPPKS